MSIGLLGNRIYVIYLIFCSTSLDIFLNICLLKEYIFYVSLISFFFSFYFGCVCCVVYVFSLILMLFLGFGEEFLRSHVRGKFAELILLIFRSLSFLINILNLKLSQNQDRIIQISVNFKFLCTEASLKRLKIIQNLND